MVLIFLIVNTVLSERSEEYLVHGERAQYTGKPSGN